MAADIMIFGIIEGNFRFYIDNGMLCALIRIASSRLDEAILIRIYNLPLC